MASASEALIFYLVEAFFPSKLAQIACLPPKQARKFLELQNAFDAEKKQLKFHVVVELFLFFAQFSFLFVHFHSS